MGSTLWVHTTPDEAIATSNISINYLQTATEGEIICTTQLDRRNRRAGMMRSEIRHEDGRLMVTAQGTFTIFPRRRLAPEKNLSTDLRGCSSFLQPCRKSVVPRPCRQQLAAVHTLRDSRFQPGVSSSSMPL
jgi:hypothetical protein